MRVPNQPLIKRNLCSYVFVEQMLCADQYATALPTSVTEFGSSTGQSPG